MFKAVGGSLWLYILVLHDMVGPGEALFIHRSMFSVEASLGDASRYSQILNAVFQRMIL